MPEKGNRLSSQFCKVWLEYFGMHKFDYFTSREEGTNLNLYFIWNIKKSS